MTDVEQLKPLGVMAALNESKSMQQSRCKEKAGHGDTRGWLVGQLQARIGGSSHHSRHEAAGGCLTLPGARLPGGPTDAW